MRIGSLFSGYGGLDLAVSQVTGATTAWVSDISKGACRILAHRFPGTPNLGDITQVNWANVEPVQILTAGFPCQDLSIAGVRAGLSGARSGLWSEVVRAITELKPRMVVLENVLGIYSASATGDVEPCAWCVGDDPDGDLRALDAVLADLATVGFDAEWATLRASDIGAPHRRERWFCIAYPKGIKQRESVVSAIRPEFTRGADGARLTLLSTPQSRDYKGIPGDSFNQANLARDISLLPTPAVNDMGASHTPETWDTWTADMRARHGNGNGHGKSLSIEVQRLLPTPTMRDHKDFRIRREPHRPRATDTLSCALTDFGDYTPAIQRWELALGRPAPEPTEPTVRGDGRRLSPRFVEWMMGLPGGWITDVPGITRSQALQACGNGVVPQQAAAAISQLIERAAS